MFCGLGTTGRQLDRALWRATPIQIGNLLGGWDGESDSNNRMSTQQIPRKGSIWDFPGGPVAENPLANAGYKGLFHPWPRKTAHASGQLNPCCATTETCTSRATLHNKRSHCNEKPGRRSLGKPKSSNKDSVQPNIN